MNKFFKKIFLELIIMTFVLQSALFSKEFTELICFDEKKVNSFEVYQKSHLKWCTSSPVTKNKEICENLWDSSDNLTFSINVKSGEFGEEFFEENYVYWREYISINRYSGHYEHRYHTKKKNKTPEIEVVNGECVVKEKVF